MRNYLILIFWFLGVLPVFSVTVVLEFQEDESEDLYFTVLVFQGEGKPVQLSEHFKKRMVFEVDESIAENFSLEIRTMGYFRVALPGIQADGHDTIRISGIRLIPSLRKKLPRGATCGTFAPRKRDIPKKLTFYFFQKEKRLIYDPEMVGGAGYYWEKEEY